MRIQIGKITTPDSVMPVKVSGTGFGKMLSRHMKPQPFSALIKDAFTESAPQAAEEVEKICADETGESINVQDLDDLLTIIISERNGKNGRRIK